MRRLMDILIAQGHVIDLADMWAKIRAGEIVVPTGRTEGEHIMIADDAEIIMNPERHRDPAKLKVLKRVKV